MDPAYNWEAFEGILQHISSMKEQGTEGAVSPRTMTTRKVSKADDETSCDCRTEEPASPATECSPTTFLEDRWEDTDLPLIVLPLPFDTDYRDDQPMAADDDADTFATLSTRGSLAFGGVAIVGTNELLPDYVAWDETHRNNHNNESHMDQVDALVDKAPEPQRPRLQPSTSFWEAMQRGDDSYFTEGFVSVGELLGNF